MQTSQSKIERAERLRAEIETIHAKADRAASTEVRLAYLELAVILSRTLDRLYPTASVRERQADESVR